MRPRLCITLSVFALLVVSLGAGNWPQWRGPQLNGVSPEVNLPVRWSATENVQWKLAMADFSAATPIIWGDAIFLNTAEGDDLYLMKVNRSTGTPVWKKALGSGNVKMRKQNMASPSPVTDGKAVYVLTGTGILKGFDFEGRELWARDIQQEYGSFGLNWGYASSPLLLDNALFVQVLHGMKTDEPSYVMRIDPATGKTVWRIERPTDAVRESPDSYTTPMPLRHEGKLQIVVTGGDYATGHDPASGRELWRMGGFNPGKDPFYRVVASAVVGDGIIFVPSRVRPLIAIRAGGRGDVTESHRMWSFENGPDVPTPVTDGKYLYVVNDKGIIYCLEAKTGEEIWGPERLKPGTYSSSLLLADGKLYATNEDGLVTVLRAGPRFEILSENAMEDYCLSTPAISDGQIFIRTTKHLFCIGERRK